jgi:hypothetical protein
MKELQVLIKQARSQGWEVERTKGDHYKWLSPRGNFFFSASTPSDRRGLLNLKRDLRINGFITIERKKGKR